MGNQKLRIFLIGVISIFFNLENTCGQIDFPDINITLKYNPESNIPIAYQVTKNDSLFIIFFSVEIPDRIDFDKNYSIKYEIKSDYKESNSLVSRTLTSNLHGIGEDEEKKYFQFEIKAQPDHNILFLRLKDLFSDIVYIKDIPLEKSLAYPPPDFFISKSNSKIPVLDSYIHADDSIQIRELASQNKIFYIYYYDHVFSAADPPMYRIDKDVSKALTVDLAFQIRSGEPFLLKKKGLYFIQNDTSSSSGISILCEEIFFPKLTTMEDIIDPVIYLTTKQEINKLKDNNNQKEAFERFWLNLAASEEKAGRLIREYFDQVETVNKIFTHYKPGWKTDMGMIYIILGPPEEVYNNGGTESWYYKRQSSTIVFNFLRLKSIFTHNHYVLIRDRQYKKAWFDAIDNWRRGIIIK